MPWMGAGKRAYTLQFFPKQEIHPERNVIPLAMPVHAGLGVAILLLDCGGFRVDRAKWYSSAPSVTDVSMSCNLFKRKNGRAKKRGHGVGDMGSILFEEPSRSLDTSDSTKQTRQEG